MKLFLIIVIVFWNVENFFDTRYEGVSESEKEFSSTGARHWTQKRFTSKADGIAKTLFLISGNTGRLPDIVAFEEVENKAVLKSLISRTLLRKLDYVPVHYESHDHRGIDCALLYRRSSFGEVRTRSIPIRDEDGGIVPTRDILLFEADGLAVLVNHHPSKLGGGAQDRREAALRTLKRACDSLAAAGARVVVAGGDYNEERSSASDALLSPMAECSAGGGIPGTIRFQGKWETIDRVQTNRPAEVGVEIFGHDFLLEEDRTHGGLKPRRCYIGPRYNGGLSDHLPLVVTISSETLSSPGRQ